MTNEGQDSETDDEIDDETDEEEIDDETDNKDGEDTKSDEGFISGCWSAVRSQCEIL